MNKVLIPLSIVMAGVVIAGAFVYINQNQASEPVSQEETPSLQEIAKKAVDFINGNLVQGTTASLIEVTEVVEEDLLKIRLKVGEKEYESYATKDGKFLFPDGYDLEGNPPTGGEESEEQPTTQKGVTIGNFSVNEDEACKEEGKPIVYFFGSSGCSHCAWEHPVIEKVAENFEGYISFHNNLDSDVDRDIFFKYSTGSVPTLVLGCKYSRVGSGSNSGEEGESQALTALICKLTDSQPSNVCDSVQELINQIE